VPEVRGREWSRSGKSVVREVSQLAAAGVREITLLGQSVMAYGRRNAVWAEDRRSNGGYTEPLTRLLEAVAAIEGIRRVRFTSGHPSGCTPELTRAVAEIPEVCEHLHLPLQSGADRILDKMRRGYSVEEYRQAVARLRERVPGMAFTTDIIVGFPTESPAEFEMTRRLCDEIGFDNAFIFKYSPRPGTPAAKWADDVPQEEKVRRNKVLLEDQNARCMACHAGMIGTVVEVLVTGVSARNAERWTGRTRRNRIVVFEPEPRVKPGDTVRVRIRKAMPQSVFGMIERGV
jgi:tRNA-2-methylthio-N6-dimethylallyladenosine synthase